MAVPSPERISINGVSYPFREMATAQAGRILEHVWRDGFIGGMGEFQLRDPTRYWFANGFDATQYPMLRLRRRFDVEVGVAENASYGTLDSASSTYGFFEVSNSPAGGTHYVYVLQGRYSYKITPAAGTLITRGDHQANSVLGHPALFEGVWYFPLGDTNVARKLTTIHDTTSADVFTNLAYNALHFATGSKDGTAQLCRAHDTNKIAFSSNGTDWGASFEVGDDSLPITDLWFHQGQYFVVKPDSVWVFTPDGQGTPLQEYGTARTTSWYDAFAGGNSFSHGVYFFWPEQNLWRFSGLRSGKPIGPEAVLDAWDGSRDGNAPRGTWHSVVAQGQWIYASRGQHVYAGFIRDDGSVLWHGAIWGTGNNSDFPRLLITQRTGGASGYSLWIIHTDEVKQITLVEDGSMRARFDADRGAASTTFSIWLPEFDFGEPEAIKQARMAWVEVRNWVAAAPLQIGYHFDNDLTANNLGATITNVGSARVERLWTPGTDDTFRYVQLKLSVATTAGYSDTASDPQIFKIGMRAATPRVERVRIGATVEGLLDTAFDRDTVVQNIRNLIGAGGVAVIEPGGVDTWTGYVQSVSEVKVSGGDHPEGEGWVMEIFIQRWDYGS